MAGTSDAIIVLVVGLVLSGLGGLVLVVAMLCAAATSDLWQAGEKSKKER